MALTSFNIKDAAAATKAVAAKDTGGGVLAPAHHPVIGTTEVSDSNPMPVSDAGGSLTVDGTVAISGTVTVGSHAVTNAGTFAVQESGSALTALQLIDDSLGTAGSAIPSKVNVAGGTDGTNARALSVTTAGLLNIADGAGSITVDNAGTFAVQATLQAGSALIGRAQMDVGGTAVSTSNPVPMIPPDSTASGSITTQNLAPAGTATANSAVAITMPGGASTLAVQVTGTYTGALSAQGTVDGSTWVTMGGVPFLNVNTGAATATITSASTGIWTLDPSGFAQARITGLAAMTGTATVSLRASSATSQLALDAPLPTGSNTVGAVTGTGTFAVQESGSALTSLQLIDDPVGTAGSASPTKIMLAGGTDGTNARALSVTTAGLVKIDSIPAGSASIGTIVLGTGSAVAGKVSLQANAADVSDSAPLAVRTPSGLIQLTATFTRPADTTVYALNDLLGINTSQNTGNAIAISSAVFVNGEALRIERIRFQKSTTGVTNASFRIHIWRDRPTFTSLGDNGAQGALTALVVDSIQYHVDYVDITMDRGSNTAAAYGVGVPSTGAGCLVRPATGTTFYLSVQALAAYTPGNAEVFTFFIEAMRA
jgi:hypothetical protein